MRRSLGLILLAALGAFASAPRLSVSGNKFVDPNGSEVILRGVSLKEVGDGQQLTGMKTASDTAAGWYSRVVRLPINPPGSENGFPVNGSKSEKDGYVANYLTPIIDAAEARGVYIIIDWHEIAEVADENANTKAFWTYMAPVFKAREHVIYEVYNEPKQTPDNWDAFKKDYAQPWVDLIRSLAPNTLILMGGPSWSQVIGGAATNPLTGGNIGYVGHIYANHITSDWILNTNIAACKKVHPVIITEWGYNETPLYDPLDSRSGYGEPLKRYIETNRMSWTAWCFGDSWQPKTFVSGWNTPTDFGRFVKEWLNEKKNLDQPTDGVGPYNLTVSAKGQGTVTRTPDLTQYAKGTSVQLKATPGAGMVFKGWSGSSSSKDNPLTVKMTSNQTLVAEFADSASASNLLTNGDFSQGAIGWILGQGTTYGGSKASVDATSGAMVVTIDNAGLLSWHIQLIMANLSIEAGHNYSLSFQASSSIPRTIDVGLSHPTMYTRYVTIKPDLTSSLETYSGTFTADSTAPARVDINLGASGTGTVTLDNVVFREVTSPSAVLRRTGAKPTSNRLQFDPKSGKVLIQSSKGWSDLRGIR